MCRPRTRIAGQPAEIDDALHTRSGRGSSEIVGGAAVGIREIRTAAHRVHKVVREFHSGEGAIERFLVKTVALDDLNAASGPGELRPIPDEAPHRAAARSEEHTSELQSPCNLV